MNAHFFFPVSRATYSPQSVPLLLLLDFRTKYRDKNLTTAFAIIFHQSLFSEKIKAVSRVLRIEICSIAVSIAVTMCSLTDTNDFVLTSYGETETAQ